jgi:hypothetical protein
MLQNTNHKGDLNVINSISKYGLKNRKYYVAVSHFFEVFENFNFTIA